MRVSDVLLALCFLRSRLLTIVSVLHSLECTLIKYLIYEFKKYDVGLRAGER